MSRVTSLAELETERCRQAHEQCIGARAPLIGRKGDGCPASFGDEFVDFAAGEQRQIRVHDQQLSRAPRLQLACRRRQRFIQAGAGVGQHEYLRFGTAGVRRHERNAVDRAAGTQRGENALQHRLGELLAQRRRQVPRQPRLAVPAGLDGDQRPAAHAGAPGVPAHVPFGTVSRTANISGHLATWAIRLGYS